MLGGAPNALLVCPVLCPKVFPVPAPPNRLPPVEVTPNPGLDAPPKRVPPVLAVPPNGEELFGAEVVFAPKPPNPVPPVVEGVLPKRPPPLVLLAPKAGFGGPNGVEFAAPNPVPVEFGDVSNEPLFSF